MSKTISSSLISDVLIETGECLAPTKVAPLKVFARDFSDDAEAYVNGKFKTAKIAFTDTAPTVAVNPTSFGVDDSSSTSAVEVGINLLSVPIMANWNDTVSIKQYVKAALQALVQKMVLTSTSLFTTTAFPAAKQVSVDISGATDDAKANALLKTLYKATKEGVNKYLIGDSDLYSLALPSNLNGFKPEQGGWGFSGIYENNVWAADTTVKGIITDGRAIAMVARVPEFAQEIRNGLESENIYIEPLDLTVQFNKWADLNGRIVKGSLDIGFGAALLDKSASKIVLQTPGK